MTLPDHAPEQDQETIVALLADYEWMDAATVAEYGITARHSTHRSDASCAICRGDLTAIAGALVPLLSERVAAARREGERAGADRYAELYQRWLVEAHRWCVCAEGPHFGAQPAGTPVRCERCGRDETQLDDGTFDRGRRTALAEFAGHDLHGLVPHSEIGDPWYHRGLDAAQEEARRWSEELPARSAAGSPRRRGGWFGRRRSTAAGR